MKLPVKWIYNLHRTALRHPQYRWLVIFGTLLYLISPIDLSPDLLPLLGQIDDIALVMLLVTGLSEIITQYLKSTTTYRNSTHNSDNNQKAATQTIDVDAVSID